MNYEASIGSSDLLSDEEIRERRNKRLMMVAAVVAIILAVAAIAYHFASAGSASPPAETESQGQTLTVVAPGRDTVARTINASGSLAARREVPVGVVGEGGRVTAVYADAGDWVKRGQTLIAIDRSVQAQQAQSLQAQIGVAQADLRLAENELSRALQLVDRGFISKADVDRKTATRDSARARVNVARAQYRQALANNARLTVTAPVSGYVLDRNVETGQTVSPGTAPIFRIAKGGELELQAQLSESDLTVVARGATATVTPVGSDRSFQGQVWQIAPMINEQTRQGVVRISLPFDQALKPGGFASVRMNAGAVTAPVLPESAIQTDKSGQNFVFIVTPENVAKRRNVELGTVTSSGVPITSGLSGSERVVLYAGGFLNDGEAVIPQMKKAAQ